MKQLQSIRQFILTCIIITGTLTPYTPAYATENTVQAISDDTVEMHHARAIVTQVNVQRGFVVVHHEPIESLGWEEMTMPLPVTDKKLLDNIQVGDRVLLDLIMPDEVATISAITVITSP